MRRTRFACSIGLAVTLLATACGGGDPAGPPTAAPTIAPSATPAPTTPPAPIPTPSPEVETVEVEVFLANAGLGDVCTEVFGVRREVPAAAPLRGALEALLAGPTEAERADGYEGWFSDETAHLLDGVRLDGTRALVSFAATLPQIIPNASSSCGSSLLLAQLDRTVTQFPSVDEAWYSLEGDRADFYGWLQYAAPDDLGPTPPAPSESPTVTPTTPAPPPPSPAPPPPAPEPPPSARSVPSSLVGTEWITLPTSQRWVALTFDAGANGDGVPKILATLAETGTPATFFLTGRWVTAYPSYSATIGQRYPVGNHTVTHPDLTTLTDAEVRDEVLGAHDAIAGATGRDPRPWFRFPYGARDARTIALVNDLDYGSVRWTVDTLGWKGTSGGNTVDTVVARVLDGLRPGEIVLMHVGSHPTDGSTLDADALGEVIRRIRGAGYEFVDLDRMLAR